MNAGFRARCQQTVRAYIGDLVLGANDGIITTFAVVAGVAGAHLSGVVVIVIGFANLMADGISMGASNYLGSRTAQALESERTGGECRRAINRGIATFFAFVSIGIVPLLAYLVPLAPAYRFPVAIVLTGIVLFVAGAARALIIPRPWWKAGAEMFAIGTLAAIGAYLVGWILRTIVGEAAM